MPSDTCINSEEEEDEEKKNINNVENMSEFP